MRVSQLLLPLLIVSALYFLFLRPQKAKQRAAQQLASSIQPGQRVVTTAGMYATVVEIDDAGVLLEIAPGVEVRYVRQAVSRVVENELVEEPLEDEQDEALEDGPFENGAVEDGYGDDELIGDEPTEEELDTDQFADTGRNHGESELVDLSKDARTRSQQPGATRFDPTDHPTDAADPARR